MARDRYDRIHIWPEIGLETDMAEYMAQDMTGDMAVYMANNV